MCALKKKRNGPPPPPPRNFKTKFGVVVRAGVDVWTKDMPKPKRVGTKYLPFVFELNTENGRYEEIHTESTIGRWGGGSALYDIYLEFVDPREVITYDIDQFLRLFDFDWTNGRMFTDRAEFDGRHRACAENFMKYIEKKTNESLKDPPKETAEEKRKRKIKHSIFGSLVKHSTRNGMKSMPFPSSIECRPNPIKQPPSTETYHVDSIPLLSN